MSIDSSKTKAASINSHHENRFLYIRYSPALLQVEFAHGWQALHTLSHLGGFARGGHALHTCHTWADSPGGWQALQKKLLRFLFGSHACSASIRANSTTSWSQTVPSVEAGSANLTTKASQCFLCRACHPWANPAPSGAMFPCRACHPWANPASSGAMFPCRACHPTGESSLKRCNVSV